MAAIKANNAKINELKEGESEIPTATEITEVEVIDPDSSDFEVEDAPAPQEPSEP
jgi:hypothetical protein